MKHKTKSIISLFMALCLMLSLGVGALADNSSEDEGGVDIPRTTEPKDGDSFDINGNTGAGLTTTPPTTPEAEETPPVEYSIDFGYDSTMGTAGATDENGNTITKAAEGKTVYIDPNPSYSNKVVSVEYRQKDTTGAYTQVNQTDDKYSFTMPAYDIVVAVTFDYPDPDPSAQAHNITVDSNITGGSVMVSGKDGGNTQSQGNTVTLTATPGLGYEFVSFSATRNEGNTPIRITTNGTTGTFTMPDCAVTVSATFTPVQTYNVNINGTFEGGSVTASPTSAAAGETVTLTASPDEGYRLESFSVTYDDGIATLATTRATQTVSVTKTGENTGTFTMPEANVTVSATFSEIQSEPETHKILTSAPHADLYIQGGADREEGDTINFTVTPHRGYYVTRVWAGTTLLTPSSGWYSFQMPANDITITVECAWWWGDWHYIHTSYNSAYGSVSVESWAYTNETVYFTVTPDSGYYYDDYDIWVYTDGGSWVPVTHYSGNTWYFTMPDDDVVIYADFDGYGKYSISKEVEGDGSISVRSSANAGDTVYIYPYPSSGQSLTSLKVYYNGGSWWYESVHGSYGKWLEVDVDYSTSRGAYYFKMPAYDVVIYAAFTDGQTVTVSDPKNGDVKVSSKYAEKGDWVYITVDPDNGYELDTLEVTNSLGRSVDVTELSENYYVFRMPGTSVKVSATFRSTTYMNFYDVSSGSWYYNAVKYVYERGIMQGTSTYYFSPDADLSRGMLATILYRMAGSPAVSDYSSFSDVSTTAYYARAIAWAEAQGIVRGVSSTSFAPDSSVTREQLVTILSRYAQYRGYDTNVVTDYLSGFGDASRASEYARPALNWAVGRHIIAGQGGGVLAPTATASRAEVAQVLMNYIAVFA